MAPPDQPKLLERMAAALRLEGPVARPRVLAALIVLPLVLTVASLVLDSVDSLAGLVAANAAILLILGLLLDATLRMRAGLEEAQARFGREVATAVARKVADPSGIVAVYKDIEAVPWRRLIGDSREQIEIVAAFFNAVVAPSAEQAALQDFLANDGRLTVVVVDHTSSETDELVTRQRDPTRRLHRHGIGERVRGSLIRVADAVAAAGVSEETVDVYLRQEPLHYAGYCFDDRTLLLAPTAHAFSPEARCPRVEIDLDLAPDFRAFWRHELEALTAGEPRRLSAAI